MILFSVLFYLDLVKLKTVKPASLPNTVFAIAIHLLFLENLQNRNISVEQLSSGILNITPNPLEQIWREHWWLRGQREFVEAEACCASGQQPVLQCVWADIHN